MSVASKVKNKIFLDDIIVPKILKSEECREYLVSIIAAVLGMDKEYVMKNLKLIDTEINENIRNKDGEVDAIVENDEMFINIEVNTKKSKQSQIKNSVYIAHLVIRQTKPGELYKMKPVVQINVDGFDRYNKNEFIYHSVVMEEKHHIKRENVFIDIYDINLDFLSKIDYNQIKKLSEKDLKWLLYIFVCQDENLMKNLYSENGMMKKVGKKMEDFMKEFDRLLVYDRIAFKEAEAREEGLEEGREKGLKEGMQQGIKQGIKEGKKEGIREGSKQSTIEIAKKMLHNNENIETIMKYTGLSKNEIEALKEELNFLFSL